MTDQQTIQNELADYLKREVFGEGMELTTETDLVDAGFDSLSLAKMLLHIEETYGFWIEESEITPESLKNVSTLAALVAAQGGA